MLHPQDNFEHRNGFCEAVERIIKAGSYTRCTLEGPNDESIEPSAYACVYPRRPEMRPYRTIELETPVLDSPEGRQHRILALEVPEAIKEPQRALTELAIQRPKMLGNALMEAFKSSDPKMPLCFVRLGQTTDSHKPSAQIFHPEQLSTEMALELIKRFQRNPT